MSAGSSLLTMWAGAPGRRVPAAATQRSARWPALSKAAASFSAASSSAGGAWARSLARALDSPAILATFFLSVRSEAAYLANRPVAEISTEAVATGAGGSESRVFDDVDGGAMGLDVLSTHVVRTRVPIPRPVAMLRGGVRVVAAAAGYTHSVLIDVRKARTVHRCRANCM